jgi:hypothetical protein
METTTRPSFALGHPFFFRLLLSLFLPAGLAAQASPLSCVSVWTAFNWTGSAWTETVLAKTVTEKYSPEGLLVSSELSLYTGGIYEKIDYLYSDKRLLKATARDGSGSLMRTTSYEYPESGGMTMRRALTLSADGSRVNEELQYFGSGGTIERATAMTAEGGVLVDRRFRYDKRLRLTEEYAAAGNDSLAWTRSCEYGKDDPSGNWLQRTDWESYRGSWPHQRYVIRRKFTYAAEAAK